MNNFSNISPAEFACKMTQGVGNVEALKHFGIDVSGVYMPEISEEIKNKAEVIANIILSGKHVELCENKDGLRIIAMDRKVVK